MQDDRHWCYTRRWSESSLDRYTDLYIDRRIRSVGRLHGETEMPLYAREAGPDGKKQTRPVLTITMISIRAT